MTTPEFLKLSYTRFEITQIIDELSHLVKKISADGSYIRVAKNMSILKKVDKVTLELRKEAEDIYAKKDGEGNIIYRSVTTADGDMQVPEWISDAAYQKEINGIYSQPVEMELYSISLKGMEAIPDDERSRVIIASRMDEFIFIAEPMTALKVVKKK